MRKYLVEYLEKFLDQMFDRASDLANQLVKDEARRILGADDDLDEFVMAMGSCFFTYKDGGKYDMLAYTDELIDQMDEEGHDWHGAYNGILHDRFQTEFMDMGDDLNDKFKVCGYPVRFMANSKEVYDWGDTRKEPIQYEAIQRKNHEKAVDIYENTSMSSFYIEVEI